MTTISIAILVALVAAAILLRRNMPLGRMLERRRHLRERSVFEDILRQVLQMEQDGRPVSAESLAGSLNQKLADVRQLLARMSEQGLLEGETGAVKLSLDGKRWAMHVLRAHRLWESYLADEAGLPMARLHQQAEREEHRLSSDDLEAIDAQLGHPTEDPHGDPIPTAEGHLERPRGASLATWDGSPFVRVVHVEDEPQELFARLVAKRMLPGAHLQLMGGSAGQLDVQLDDQTISLEQELLPNVEVEEDHEAVAANANLIPLSRLQTGQAAELVSISSAIRGFSRRRLLDFGLTRGTRIEPILDNPFGDPRAFFVRGTTIAVRREQADLIWVKLIRNGGATVPVPAEKGVA